MHYALGGALVVVLGLAAPSGSEPAHLRFFPCAVVQFFGEACVPATGLVGPVPNATDVPAPPASSTPDPEAQSPAVPPPAAPLPPLFAPETVSPDMPPLLLKVLQEPTTANAQAFLTWYQARLQRIREVQALLRALQQPEAPRTTGDGRATP
jgi:hypothetical protein